MKFRAPRRPLVWHDGIMGEKEITIENDFVLKRKEGIYAYQLAVVTDDIAQQISHVIRGADLVESTPMQLALYEALELPAPNFSHFPVMKNAQGQKLSKQNHSPAVDNAHAIDNLAKIVEQLGIEAPPAFESCEQILKHAAKHWSTKPLNAIEFFNELKR